MSRRPSDSSLDSCDVHQTVLLACIDDLTKSQVFNMADVLRRLGYTGIAAAVYWDYIRRKIENGGMSGGLVNIELLPVSSVFFKRRRKPSMSLNSLLAGPGGKAAGYALATIEHGQIALAAANLYKNRANGMARSGRRRADSYVHALEGENSGVVVDRLRALAHLEGGDEQ